MSESLWNEWPTVPKEIQSPMPGRTYLTTWPASWTQKILSERFGLYGQGWGVSDTVSEILMDGKIYCLKGNFWYMTGLDSAPKASFPMEMWEEIKQKNMDDVPKIALTSLISKAALMLGVGYDVVSKEKGASAPPPRKRKDPIRKAVDDAVAAVPRPEPEEDPPHSKNDARKIVNKLIKGLERAFGGDFGMMNPNTKSWTPQAEAMMRVIDSVFGTNVVGGKDTIAVLYDRAAGELSEAIQAKSKAAVELELEELKGKVPF